jgi:hypothetical protein
VPVLSSDRIAAFLETARNGVATTDRGRALEDLLCYAFGCIPGIAITHRDQLNVFESEEIDIALWNDKKVGAFDFLPHIVLLESKNWSNAVGSAELAWFDTKLRNRGLDFGILVALNGITGNSADKTSAHQIIAASLREQRQLVVLTGTDISNLHTTTQLVKLIKTKLCDLAVTGTLVL